MWNERNLLLFAHVVGAIVLLGPTTMATSSFGRHVRTRDIGAATSAHRTSRAYGTASMVVPVVGAVLAQRIDVFGDLWVQLAIGLFVVGAVLLGAVHLPAQRVALDHLRLGEDVDAGLAGRLQASAGAYALTWVIIVWLMVAKPV
jgi:uncharacterized membrane protein